MRLHCEVERKQVLTCALLIGSSRPHKLALSPNPVAPTWFERFPATTAMATIASFLYTSVPSLLLPDMTGSRSQTTPGRNNLSVEKLAF